MVYRPIFKVLERAGPLGMERDGLSSLGRDSDGVSSGDRPRDRREGSRVD